MRRRGVMYLFVLATTLLVVVIGFSALVVAMRRQRNAEDLLAAARARQYARAAVELGLQTIYGLPTWRTVLVPGTWISGMDFGDGGLTLDANDPVDGDFSDAPDDPVVFKATGTAGPATYRLRVLLEPDPRPLDCLEVAAAAASGVSFSFNSDVAGTGPITSNADMLAVAANVQVPVEASGSINGSTYNAGQTAGAPARQMPDGTVFDYYVSRGTVLDYNSLSSTGTIDRELLSPNSNPFGDPNPEGIYVIDCGGNDIVIRNSRIVGTLVLLNTGSGSVIDGAIVIEPAFANYPCLLVQGGLIVALDSATLNESDFGVNFNPPGTPYNGQQDSDTSDSYGSAVRGIVCVTGTLAVMKTSNVFVGNVVCDKLIVFLKASAVFTYDSSAYDDPPPGFIDFSRMRPAQAGFRRIVP